MEFFGDEALIFTKLFQGESHILWKSSGVNVLFNLQGVVENKSKSSTETGEWEGGGGVEGVLVIYVKIYAIAHFNFRYQRYEKIASRFSV